MLSSWLRIELLVIAVFFIVTVICNVNRKKLLLQYSLIWLVLALGMIILAAFPVIASILTELADIEEPSNFIYAIGLFVLLFVSFHHTGKISKQSNEIRALIEQEAINRYLLERNIRSKSDGSEAREP
ncbi:MAG: hypothetical protein H6Q60_159 [Oscillospiraceae bacterium]|nr:hypothetical protein [Oscillospiraceae bacterium]